MFRGKGQEIQLYKSLNVHINLTPILKLHLLKSLRLNKLPQHYKHQRHGTHIIARPVCHFHGYYIFKYFSSYSHCIQDLAHRVGWRSTCIRNICKNWKNFVIFCWSPKVALWHSASDCGLLHAELAHWQNLYYCKLLASDFVSTFYLLALLTGPYHKHW